jgi:SAM-dependent methyltransferase
LKPVDRARALSTPAEAVALYREWAQQYDHDVFATAGFTGSSRIADLLVEQMQRHGVAANTPILDLGCGTGAVGVRLHEHGCTVIDGLDISSEMLTIAASKQVYRNLSVADLTQPVAAAERYRACVSAGTFTSGHVGPSSVDHLAALLVDDALVGMAVVRGGLPGSGADVARLRGRTDSSRWRARGGHGARTQARLTGAPQPADGAPVTAIHGRSLPAQCYLRRHG